MRSSVFSPLPPPPVPALNATGMSSHVDSSASIATHTGSPITNWRISRAAVALVATIVSSAKQLQQHQQGFGPGTQIGEAGVMPQHPGFTLPGAAQPSMKGASHVHILW